MIPINLVVESKNILTPGLGTEYARNKVRLKK